jgi:hypothetical protein
MEAGDEFWQRIVFSDKAMFNQNGCVNQCQNDAALHLAATAWLDRCVHRLQSECF